MISVNEPVISKKASRYVLDCLNTAWVSSAGKDISKFEDRFASYIGTKHAITTTSGTAALHLALSTLKIGPGDEVIIPDLTIISCALAVIYLGGTPIFVDVDENGNIDPSKIEEKITKRTKAIMVVHLFGHPANIILIKNIAKKHNLYLIEDAAQAHGAKVLVENHSNEQKHWQKVGSFGNISCFSFYGNKIITTGEGGMMLTNNKELADKARLLKDLAHSPKKRFLHHQVGYNYRMTNIQAALGLAQLEQIEKYLAKKREIAKYYSRNLKKLKYIDLPLESRKTKSVFWMYAVRIKKSSPIKKFSFRAELKKYGVDTRDFFIPLHRQPVLIKLGFGGKNIFPLSDDLSKRGFYIPSGLAITKKQMQEVVNAMTKISNRNY